MKIRLLAVGKTHSVELQRLIDEYRKRLAFYIDFEMIILADKHPTSLPEDEQKKREGQAILKNLDRKDTLILMDEKGMQYTSIDFSEVIEGYMTRGLSRLVFVIGGAWGFSTDLEQRATSKIALSKMTFTHQMVRLIFLEQLYRAFTIIRNESYHHQ